MTRLVTREGFTDSELRNDPWARDGLIARRLPTLDSTNEDETLDNRSMHLVGLKPMILMFGRLRPPGQNETADKEDG